MKSQQLSKLAHRAFQKNEAEFSLHFHGDQRKCSRPLSQDVWDSEDYRNSILGNDHTVYAHFTRYQDNLETGIRTTDDILNTPHFPRDISLHFSRKALTRNMGLKDGGNYVKHLPPEASYTDVIEIARDYVHSCIPYSNISKSYQAQSRVTYRVHQQTHHGEPTELSKDRLLRDYARGQPDVPALYVKVTIGIKTRDGRHLLQSLLRESRQP